MLYTAPLLSALDENSYNCVSLTSTCVFLSNALIYRTGGILYRALYVDTELGKSIFLPTIKLYVVTEVRDMVLQALFHVKCKKKPHLWYAGIN
jgi:hypothetical protein